MTKPRVERHSLPVASTIIVIVVAWTVWVWVRFPAPKVPSDKAVIEALTKQFEQQKQKSYDEGYDWCNAQVGIQQGIDAYWEEQGKKLDPLNNGDPSGRPVAK